MFSEKDSFEFFISRIKQQAKKENIDLSDLEVEMLRFSVETTDESLLKLNERFEVEINQNKYEKKIVNLLQLAYTSETNGVRHSSEQERIKKQYTDAAKKLHEKDNYITVMIDQVVKPEGFLSKFFKSIFKK